jgi:hypothetical protein
MWARPVTLLIGHDEPLMPFHQLARFPLLDGGVDRASHFTTDGPGLLAAICLFLMKRCISQS